MPGGGYCGGIAYGGTMPCPLGEIGGYNDADCGGDWALGEGCRGGRGGTDTGIGTGPPYEGETGDTMPYGMGGWPLDGLNGPCTGDMAASEPEAAWPMGGGGDIWLTGAPFGEAPYGPGGTG